MLPRRILLSQQHASCLFPWWCSAVIGVIAALASHGLATAMTMTQQQSSSNSLEGDDLAWATGGMYMMSAFLLTGAIRDSGQLARLTDADALRFGSAVSLAVRGMPGAWLCGRLGGDAPCVRVACNCSTQSIGQSTPACTESTPLPCAVLLPGFVARAEAEARGSRAPTPVGSLLMDLATFINTGTSLLIYGVQDVLAGPEQPDQQQQFSPRVQRALQATTLQPQQLVAWLDSMVAATRVLFRLKGEHGLLYEVCSGWQEETCVQQNARAQLHFYSWLAACYTALCCGGLCRVVTWSSTATFRFCACCRPLLCRRAGSQRLRAEDDGEYLLHT